MYKPLNHPALNVQLMRGFTLIEAMIVLVVLGVILSIAVPTYQGSLRKSRRAEARLILTDTSQRLERCFAECNSYTASSCPSPCPSLPITSNQGSYQITTAIR